MESQDNKKRARSTSHSDDELSSAVVLKKQKNSSIDALSDSEEPECSSDNSWGDSGDDLLLSRFFY